MNKIITEFVHPPIPDRSCDWSAVTDDYDGPGSPIGRGRTEAAAIADLKDRLEGEIQGGSNLEIAEQMAEETRDTQGLAAAEINLAKQIDTFGATAIAIKMQRDTLADALRDIRMGADMMLQPACNLTGSIRGYVLEVKRVATEGLKEAQLS